MQYGGPESHRAGSCYSASVSASVFGSSRCAETLQYSTDELLRPSCINSDVCDVCKCSCVQNMGFCGRTQKRIHGILMEYRRHRVPEALRSALPLRERFSGLTITIRYHISREHLTVSTRTHTVTPLPWAWGCSRNTVIDFLQLPSHSMQMTAGQVPRPVLTSVYSIDDRKGDVPRACCGESSTRFS